MTKKRKKYDAYIALICQISDKIKLEQKRVEYTLNHNTISEVLRQ